MKLAAEGAAISIILPLSSLPFWCGENKQQLIWLCNSLNNTLETSVSILYANSLWYVDDGCKEKSKFQILPMGKDWNAFQHHAWPWSFTGLPLLRGHIALSVLKTVCKMQLVFWKKPMKNISFSFLAGPNHLDYDRHFVSK